MKRHVLHLLGAVSILFIATQGFAEQLPVGEMAQQQGRRSLRPYIGSDDFMKVVTEGSIFVDKTLFIKDIIEHDRDTLLITRPRRWGKSLNMSMLKYFFNREVDEAGKPLEGEQNPYRWMFQKMKIANETTVVTDKKTDTVSTFDIIERFQGQYPTVLLSFKDVKKTTYEEMRHSIATQLVELFSQYRYLREIADCWNESGQNHIKFNDKIRERIEKSIGLENSLKTLSSWLYAYHGKKVYILIDEYDTPLNQAYIKGYADQAVPLMRELFGAAFKSNLALEKGILTGILRIAKADLFSGLNNFSEDSVLDNRYARHLGFTEGEVTHLLRLAQVENTQAVKEWYNGYRIGNETIYNPWSFMNYLSALSLDDPTPLQPYWVDSGGVDLIKKELFSQTAKTIWESVESGKDLFVNVKKSISLTDLTTPDDLYSMLLHAGYLTLSAKTLDDDHFGAGVFVKIPNDEVRLEFNRLIRDFLQRNAITEPGYVGEVFEAILEENSNKLGSLFKLGKKIDFNPWNFNFLQIAALVGNEEVLNLVRNHHKDLREVRHAENLGVTDFAVLGNKTFASLEGYKVILREPSFYEYTCLVAGPIAGGTVGLLKWMRGRGTAVGWSQKAVNFAVDTAGGAIVGGAVKNLLSDHCKDYLQFHKTDISKPMELDSLMGFGKYVVYHPNSYVALNNPCPSTHTQIAAITRPAISINDVAFTNFNFALCGEKNQELREGL